jgi:hypothetical protein
MVHYKFYIPEDYNDADALVHSKSFKNSGKESVLSVKSTRKQNMHEQRAMEDAKLRNDKIQSIVTERQAREARKKHKMHEQYNVIVDKYMFVTSVSNSRVGKMPCEYIDWDFLLEIGEINGSFYHYFSLFKKRTM